MSLDPEVESFLQAFYRAAPPAFWEVPVEQSRAGVVPAPGPPEEVGGVSDRCIDGPLGPIRVRAYEPTVEPLGTVLFFHGGGWVTGNLDTHDALCRRLCNESGSRIVAVDYRLAPEHKFPAAADDAHAATTWAAETYGTPLAVLGDSAGGNLAAAAALMARDRGGPAIAAQVLVYPITDCGCDTPSYHEFAEGYFLNRPSMQWFWEQYAPDPERAAHPYASMLRAESLTGLPPSLIVTAEYDVLRDEGIAYADRLHSAGIMVERISYAGMIHGFLRRLHQFRRAEEAVALIGEYLQRSFRC
ncbi:MAG: alpha/beta hydrolase [Planctomycetaceae bacterium]|nr:alpha/beta hydrolase [Planctomycetaceae bacterium]